MRHAFCALLLLATGSSSQLDTGECVGKDSFTPLSFDEATLVRSNLGGMGGRCWLDIGNSTGLCADDTAPTATSPRELYFSTLGADRITGDKIDLRIKNLTEYRWWSKKWNGIKRIEVDGTVGYFGAVNLLGPRARSQIGKQWDSEFTMVELKYEFANQRTSDPYVIDRTYMSFYDFDTGEANFEGSETQVEVMQMDPAATSLMRALPSEIVQYASWADFLSADALASFESRFANIDQWPTPINTATTNGIGNDNPANPSDLTAQQRARMATVQLDGISSFKVRYAISACCTTGRNFLFAGYSNMLPRLCPEPPSLPLPWQPPPPSPTSPPPPPYSPHNCDNLDDRLDLGRLDATVEPYPQPPVYALHPCSSPKYT